MHDPKTRRDADQSSDVPTRRVYFDADGHRWQVYEKAFDPFDRRSGMSLIFASDGAMRRVRNYPANWIDLSDEELAKLSWNS